MSSSFQFRAMKSPVPWTGRYSRIPGKEPAFHVSADGVVTIQWFDPKNDERLCARIRPSPVAHRLGSTLNTAKTHFSGAAGGSFAINEFGQVLCPVQGSLMRYLIGVVSGIPEFVDPRCSGKHFTLCPAKNTPAGARWDRPYLGMKFNLDTEDRVYFKMDDQNGTRRLYCPAQDPDLVKRLRSVRLTGSIIRFIVNLHGAVFTKREPSWEPVFVGFIDKKHWFKEEGA